MNNAIRISCELSNLQIIRDFVRKFLSSYVLKDTVREDMVLAVDEISANLIIHANKEDKSKYINLSITDQNESFLFEFTDQGIPFDSAIYKKPNIDEFIINGKKGGIGLALVHYIMDKVEFITDKKGTNICRLYKKVPATTKSNNLINK